MRWSADAFRAVTLPHSQTQTPNFTATQSRCGSRLQDGEDVPNGATLRRGSVEKQKENACARSVRQRGLHHRHNETRRTSEDCHKGERRSGQRGKRSREYDHSTKSDRQIASTTKPRLRRCGTARQRPHFPLYQSQQQERCRRKAALKFPNFMTNRYICKRKNQPYKIKHTSAIKNHIYVVLYGDYF